MTTYRAHIFKQKSVGPREEIKLKLFMPDGTPVELGGGGFQKVETTLDHEAILSLASTPYELIAPTQILDYDYATSFPVIIQARFSLRMGENSYGNFNPTQINSMYLCYGADESFDIASIIALVQTPTQEWTIGRRDMRYMFNGSDSSYFGKFFTEGSPSRTDWQDNGVYLLIETPGIPGPLTGGNPEDKLRITILYEIFEMV